MKVTLSFEESESSDVSIMVDALRASSTITVALDKFEKIIPCFTLAGERMGRQVEGFDLGNSPTAIDEFETCEDTLILTTTNGTRILENMHSTALVGCLINAEAVAKKSIELAQDHIDVVMAGVKGEFAIEDFLASGEILYWISQYLDDCDLSEYGQTAVLATRNYDSLKDSFINSRTAKRLIELGYQRDVEFCSLKNITENVAIYENSELKLNKD